MIGLDVLGADTAYTDPDTVRRVQEAIMSLPQTKEPFADKELLIAKATGELDAATKRAVARYNDMYIDNAKDGDRITDRTLEGLKVAAKAASTPKKKKSYLDKAEDPYATLPRAQVPGSTPPGWVEPDWSEKPTALAKRPLVPEKVTPLQAGLVGLAVAGVGYGIYKMANWMRS